MYSGESFQEPIGTNLDELQKYSQARRRPSHSQESRVSRDSHEIESFRSAPHYFYVQGNKRVLVSGTMNFSSSSQRKSWVFSQHSLDACKQRAVAGSAATRGRVQKFASGFHSQWKRSTGSVANQPPATTERTSSMLSVRDQETLVQFHAHQIQTLVGPHALVTELRRSQKVLSTAVVLFRRFFLSNSVIEFNPRKIATAAAFLAAKLEEERVEVSFRGPFLFRHGRQCLLGVTTNRTFWSICTNQLPPKKSSKFGII